MLTFKFDRSTEIHPSMVRALENAAKNRGIVVATPTAIKSVMLTYVETMEHLKLARAGEFNEKTVDTLVKESTELQAVMRIFKQGCMLLDEVDLILHPLKSELNFPKGEKFGLDVSDQGERWGLPIHLMDAIFFAQTQKVSTFENRGSAVQILKRISNTIQEGYNSRSLQRLPHIVLLNMDFYHAELKPLMAEWAFLWLQKNHLHGIDREEAIHYLLTGAASRSEATSKISYLTSTLQILQKKEASSKDPVAMRLTRLDKEDSMFLPSALQPTNIINPHDGQAFFEEAISHSQELRRMGDLVYEDEEQYEEFLAQAKASIARLEADIERTSVQIKEAEFPRGRLLGQWSNSVVLQGLWQCAECQRERRQAEFHDSLAWLVWGDGVYGLDCEAMRLL